MYKITWWTNMKLKALRHAQNTYNDPSLMKINAKKTYFITPVNGTITHRKQQK